MSTHRSAATTPRIRLSNSSTHFPGARLTKSLEDDLTLAHNLAALASEVALDFFRRGVSTQSKADGTPVSEADFEVERQLLNLLAKERPDDAVLSEEFGTRGSSSRRWILDPIDGTFNFVTGNPLWGTHVALEDRGEIVLGLISRPVLDRYWWATRDGGAHRSDPSSPSGTRLRASAISALAKSRISIWTRDPDERWGRLERSGVRVEPDLNDILKLAEGELEAVIDLTGKVWDHAPAMVLVEEAGGRFSDGRGGRRLNLGIGRYTNGHIDEQLDRVLAG